MVELRQIVKVTCDGPNCAQHHKQPVTLEWDETNPDSIPDAAFRLLTVVLVTQEKHSFCSALCAQDWFETVYKPFVFPCEGSCKSHEHGDTVPVRLLLMDGGQPHNFCSVSALKGWLKTSYTPLLSPKEQAARDAKNAEVKTDGEK